MTAAQHVFEETEKDFNRQALRFLTVVYMAQQEPQNTEEATQITEAVEGRELVPEQQEQAAPTEFLPWVLFLIAGCVLLIAVGFWAGRGIPSK